MRLLRQVGAGRGQPLADAQQLPVEVGHDDFSPQHVLLAGVTGGVAGLGDRDEINRQLAIIAQNLGGLFVEVEIVIRALDVGDHGELGGCQFGQGDFDVLFGRLAAEAEGAEPGKLLRDEYVVGVVAHERVLRRNAGDRVDGVGDERVVKGGDLRNASLRPPDLQQSSLRGLRLIHQRG